MSICSYWNYQYMNSNNYENPWVHHVSNHGAIMEGVNTLHFPIGTKDPGHFGLWPQTRLAAGLAQCGPENGEKLVGNRLLFCG